MDPCKEFFLCNHYIFAKHAASMTLNDDCLAQSQSGVNRISLQMIGYDKTFNKRNNLEIGQLSYFFEIIFFTSLTFIILKKGELSIFEGWRRTAKSDHEEEAMSDPNPLDRRDSKSEIQVPRTGLKGKMSFKTASHAAISLIGASKRIQGGMKSLGKKMSKSGSSEGWF